MYVRPILMFFNDARGERRMLIHSSTRKGWGAVAQAVTRTARCQRWQVAGPGMYLQPGELYPEVT
jgi:hypothetical protein